jgi:signal transduction histidine kinase
MSDINVASGGGLVDKDDESTAALLAACDAIAHDLKSTVGQIMTSSDMVHTYIERNDDLQARKWNGRVHQSAESLLPMVDSFVNVLRMAQQPIRLVDASLSSAVRLAVDLAASTAQQAGKKIVFDEQSQIRAMFDFPATARLLGNLLGNAIRYSPPASSIRVAVTSVMDPAEGPDNGAGKMTIVTVTNACVNFDPATLPRLGEANYRGPDYANKPSGSGLGIANAKELAGKMLGRLEYSYDNANKELTATLSLHQ